MFFNYGSGRQRIDDNKKCRRIAGNFDCHADAAVWLMWGTASLEATGYRHQASARIALLLRLP
jgi:hypothetical protein